VKTGALGFALAAMRLESTRARSGAPAVVGGAWRIQRAEARV